MAIIIFLHFVNSGSIRVFSLKFNTKFIAFMLLNTVVIYNSKFLKFHLTIFNFIFVESKSLSNHKLLRSLKI